jgi:hypothetical protein
MEGLSREDRLRLAAGLNWDYDVDVSVLLEVIDGSSLKAGPFDAQRLLVRSLERLSWHRIVALWGIDRLLAVYEPSLLSRIRSSEFRRRYAFVFGLLRNEAVPTTGWSPEMRRRMQDGLFSHRWYRAKPGLLQP